MLHWSLPHKTLLRLAGSFLLLLAGYQAFTIASRPFSVDGSANIRPLLAVSIPETWVEIASAGILLAVAVAIALLGLASLRPRLAYWCLQAALWLAGCSLWYQQGPELTSHLVPGLLTPVSPWPCMVITLVCSLILLTLYRPTVRFFGKLVIE